MPRFSPAVGSVFGVTGTNGKTSTAWFLAAGLEAAGRRTYLASTIGDRFDGTALGPAPSFDALIERLEDLEKKGATGFVLECTSHALAKGFAQRVRFDAAVFTNLTREHIDQHQSWEHYLASKAQLFVSGLRQTGVAVLNASDEHSTLLDEVMDPTITRYWYACSSRGPSHHRADLAVEGTEVSADCTRASLAPSPLAEELGGALEIKLVGDVFAENAIAAALALRAIGIQGAAIRSTFAEMAPVPGRFEVVHRRPLIVVDYAHTPDALAHTCATARKLATTGRVIVVFGAGGNRDRSKRGPMGTSVGRAADIAIVTSDNPRDEPPADIANVLAHAARAAGRARVVVELDRARAIEVALAEARDADVVIVCGKGHERGQLIGNVSLPFSDVDVLRAAVGSRI